MTPEDYTENNKPVPIEVALYAKSPALYWLYCAFQVLVVVPLGHALLFSAVAGFFFFVGWLTR